MKQIFTKDYETEVLQSEIPVVVDFYADWCTFCKRMAPIVAELESDYEDKIKFVSFDNDSDRDFANSLDVMSLPTFIFYKGGKEVSRNGSISIDDFDEKLEKLLQK